VNVRPAIEKAASPPVVARAYCYRHQISFEETNLVGNVYFTRYLSWQGRCRELFLKEHAPEILDDLASDLRLVTLNVSCEFFLELRAFEDVEVRMSLAHLRGHRIGLGFEYGVQRSGVRALAARGAQEIGCMRHTPAGLVACAVPGGLANALAAYR
jgi:enediyne biosynthesis thioesterase